MLLILPHTEISAHQTVNIESTGDGRCVICDSYVRPATLVRICDECNYGSYQGRCVGCGGPGVSDAYYCKECTIQEKDVCCPRVPLLSCAGYAFKPCNVPSTVHSSVREIISR